MYIVSMIDDSYSELPEGKTKDNFIRTLEMCKTDCSFMSTAINRAVDFAKSSPEIGEELLFICIELCSVILLVSVVL
jgi:predicted naringenin-chalcone synthase